MRQVAHLREIGVWILRGEIEHLLHDARDRFAVAIRDGEQSEIIVFAQERIGRRHKPARDDRAATNR